MRQQFTRMLGVVLEYSRFHLFTLTSLSPLLPTPGQVKNTDLPYNHISGCLSNKSVKQPLVCKHVIYYCSQKYISLCLCTPRTKRVCTFMGVYKLGEAPERVEKDRGYMATTSLSRAHARTYMHATVRLGMKHKGKL